MISGTYVLTDSIDQAFDKIFTDIRKGSNAVISGKSAFDSGDRTAITTPTFDESLLPKVRGAARASRRPRASVDGRRRSSSVTTGRRSSSAGRRTSASRSRTATRVFNPSTLVDGAWPGPNEVVVDKETAGNQDFESARRSASRREGPVEALRVSGIVQFSSGLTIGGATLAGFDLPTAQRLFNKRASSTRSPSPRSRTSPDAELVDADRRDPPADGRR